MIPLLTSLQIRQTDAYTIAHEPISSINLMERASTAFADCFVQSFPDKDKSIAVYCGTGNNGGDGLAIARILHGWGYQNISVKVAWYSDKASDDFRENYKRLMQTGVGVVNLNSDDALPSEQADIIIDALLGTGLNKPLADAFARLVTYLNSLSRTVVSVDVPSGLFCEGEIAPGTVAIKSDLTITFQQPKINYLLPESAPYIANFKVVDIGLDEAFVRSLDSPYQLTDEADVKTMLKSRKAFSHKGTYGHTLIIAGSPQTMGAALLSAMACLSAGSGLTTVCIPQDALTALNASLPEVMAILRKDNELPDINWDKYDVIAIGPGLGTSHDALALLTAATEQFKKPMVIDADALNLLAKEADMLKRIPKGSVLTPHLKEFDRLFGEHTSWWQRLQTMRQKAM